VKILCISDGVLGHITPRVRGGVYRELFERQGWEVAFADVSRDAAGDILRQARDSSVIYLLKVGSPGFLRRLRAATRAPLVFDFTDPLWMRAFRLSGWHDLERVLRAVDAVICENEMVAARAKRFNDAVFVVPTCAQTELFDAVWPGDGARAPSPGPTARVRIGWVGSRTTVSALEKVREPLRRVCARHPEAEVRLVGCRPGDAARILGDIPHSVVAEYDESDMVREMLALDVGLFPAPRDDEDYRARGALKALLYLAAGVPPLCQEGGDCSRLLREGETGMLASGEEEWEAKLEALVGDEGLRRRIGGAGRDWVRREHSLAVIQGLTRDALVEAIRRKNEGLRGGKVPAWTVRAGEWLRGRGYRFAGFARRVRRKLS
jgi:glycosyltransferase involved in cell wall biosynthesis